MGRATLSRFAPYETAKKICSLAHLRKLPGWECQVIRCFQRAAKKTLLLHFRKTSLTGLAAAVARGGGLLAQVQVSKDRGTDEFPFNSFTIAWKNTMFKNEDAKKNLGANRCLEFCVEFFMR